MSSAHPYTWQRSDGTTGRAWRARWTGQDGAPKGRRGFTRRADALAFGADREAEVRHGVQLEHAPLTGKTTVASWAQRWLEVQRVRPSTRSAYGYVTRRIIGDLGGRALTSLRTSELKAWRSDLDRRYAASTADQTAAVMAMMLRAAVLDGLLPTSPWPTRIERAPRRLLDPEELLTLPHVQAWGAAMPSCAQEMPLVAAMTGLRQGELLGLRLPQVDFLRRQVRVTEQLITPAGPGGPTWGPPKTAAGVRTVPLPARAAEVLARHLERFPPVDGEPIFRSPRGKRWRRGGFGEAWQRAKREAGLPEWAHWHGLRDLFASSLIYTRQDSHVITTLMGHSSPAELAPYARLWPNAQDKARQAIEGLWVPGALGDSAGVMRRT